MQRKRFRLRCATQTFQTTLCNANNPDNVKKIKRCRLRYAMARKTIIVCGLSELSLKYQKSNDQSKSNVQVYINCVIINPFIFKCMET